jgi:hypothetical protein
MDTRLGVTTKERPRMGNHMNFFSITCRTACAICVALAIQSLGPSSTTALAAAPVDVNPAPQIQNPYQITETIGGFGNLCSAMHP